MDVLAVLAALLLSHRLREAQIDLIPRVQLLDPSPTLPSIHEYLWSFALPGAAVFLCVAALLGLYVLRSTGSAWNEIGKIIIAGFVWTVLVMAWYFLIAKELFYSRILLAHSTLFIILFVMVARATIILLQRACLRTGIGVRLVVSIGTHPIAHTAHTALLHDAHYKYLGHLSDLSRLQSLCSTCRPDLVVQTDPDPSGKSTLTLIEYCRSHHLGYAFLPPVFADVPHLLRVERLGLVPMLQFFPTPLDGWGRVLKRLFDLSMSVLLLLILSPLLLLIAVAIVLESGFPVLYRSRRIGEYGEIPIDVWKFRSMIRGADERKQELLQQNERNDGPLFKIRADPRVTRVGRVLRRFDLDELPQLFNVLWGQMSLVGPRPHLPDEVSRYSEFQRRVFAIKPGVTGLAQVSGRSTLKFDEEVRFDLQYIEEWSLALDLWILWRTLFVVFWGKENG